MVQRRNLHGVTSLSDVWEPQTRHVTVRVTALGGNANDPQHHELLHDLRHAARVEYVTIKSTDLARKRLRVTTDRGTECTIALPRDTPLEHGSLLEINEHRAIIVQLEELPWLCLQSDHPATALRLGFLAGHHHWRVRFEGTRMYVALDQPRESYLHRLHDYLGPVLAATVRIDEDG